MRSRSRKSGGETDNVGQPVYVHTERARDSDRRTRKPLVFWDRVKFLLLLVLLWLVLVWSHGEQPDHRVQGRGQGASDQERLGPGADRPGGAAPAALPVSASTGPATTGSGPRGLRRHRPGQPPAERLDQVPDRARC